MPFKANNNREAVVVCARHVVKRPSKRSVLVYSNRPKVFEKPEFQCIQERFLAIITVVYATYRFNLGKYI